jgi:hypothetical protein
MGRHWSISPASFCDVCFLPKMGGGLDIKRPRRMNDAFLMKMLSNLINKPNDLWCKVLYGKYGRNDDGHGLTYEDICY